MEGDINKFESGKVKACGRRARGACQEIKALAQEIRLDIQKEVNAA
jgi:hypothetical protein